MTETRTMVEDVVAQLTKEFVDQGKLIEAGWIAFRMQVMAPDVGAVQLEEMRLAYFAGAQHLFSSIVTMLDADAEITDADLQRMAHIDAELAAFAEVLRARAVKTRGSA